MSKPKRDHTKKSTRRPRATKGESMHVAKSESPPPPESERPRPKRRISQPEVKALKAEGNIKIRAQWLESWMPLLKHFGSAEAISKALHPTKGPTPQTIWRWGIRGDAVAPGWQIAIRILCAQHNLKSPV